MCFSLESLKDIVIWIIIICGVVALIRLCAKYLLPRTPEPLKEFLSFLIEALWIVLWVIIAVAISIFLIDLIGCALVSMPRLR